MDYRTFVSNLNKLRNELYSHAGNKDYVNHLVEEIRTLYLMYSDVLEEKDQLGDASKIREFIMKYDSIGTSEGKIQCERAFFYLFPNHWYLLDKVLGALNKR